MTTKLLETKFLFEKMKKLYPTFQLPDELDIDCWTEVLAGYSQDEILKALKAYRKTVEYNTAPIPSVFAKFLHEENGAPKHKETQELEAVSGDVKEEWRLCWNTTPDIAYYLRDVATKPAEQVHALLFYRWALKDIITEMVDTLPYGKEMSYSRKIDLIRRNGWDNDITERAERYATQQNSSTKYQSLKSATNTLASHWRA